MVASTLGAHGLAEDPVKLVAGATDGFRELLIEQGIETSHAGALCKQLEMYAARTLFQSRCPDLPSGFVAAVNKAQEVSYELASTA